MGVELVASRGARAKNAVALCVDENYFPFACFVADQIQRKAIGLELDIVICAPESCVVPEGLVDIRLCHIETHGLFDGLFLDARRTENVYHWLALPVAMQSEYERILYLDADIYFHGGDLAELFAIDMGSCPIAAVRDNCQWVKQDKLVAIFKRLSLPAEKYLNSGVILIDVQKFVSEDILGRCLTYGRKMKGKQRQHDQELINCVLHGNWTELSPMWNWQQPLRSAYFEVYLPVRISHFIGPGKPWRDPDRIVPQRYVMAISAFIARNFPEIPQIEIPKSTDLSAANVRKATVKNVIRQFTLMRYVKRFPTDLLAADD